MTKDEAFKYAHDLLTTEYHYDLEEPGDYQSKNNRLEHFEVYDTEGKAQTLLSTTWYYYRDDDDVDFGNVTRIVTKPEASAVYKATRFGYARNGRTVTFVVGEEWEWSGNPAHCPTDYTITYGKEFRYDGARQRYLVRELDLTEFDEGNIVAESEVWTDYDGDSPYGDYELTAGNPPTLTELTSHEPGLATVLEWTDEGDGSTFYHATDHLGSVRHWTDNSGFQVTPAVYTAFGEIKYEPAEHHRYGYVGSHGYQQHDEFKFLHVGHRYYDPATGRFLQRDPIGIRGGNNVYEYVNSSPTIATDPTGLERPVRCVHYAHDEPDCIAKRKPRAPEPPLSPEEELNRIKKRIRIFCAGSVVGGGCLNKIPKVGLWGLTALTCPIALLIDEVTHADEGVNPVFGIGN